VGESLVVRIDHHSHELGEVDLRLPAELRARLGRVTSEPVDLGVPGKSGSVLMGQ